MRFNGFCHFVLQKEPIKLPKEPELPRTMQLPKEPDQQLKPEPEQEPEPEPEPEPIAAPVQYTEPEAPIQSTTMVNQQPDVIPTQHESVQSDIYETVAPPAAFSGNENGHAVESVPEIVQSVPEPVVNEQIYSNIDYVQQQAEGQLQQEPINPAALAGSEDCDLSEYIEDTKIQAVALYDYQASAEDEISFDPNDIITHIEKVSGTQNLRFEMVFIELFQLIILN